MKMSVRKVLGVAKLDENLKEEAIRYFADKPVMAICIKQIHKKYESFGRFTGTISKSLFKKVDAEPLLMFMGIAQWEWEKSKSIKISDFKRNYEESKFESIPFELVVESISGRQLRTKQELADDAEAEYAAFLAEIDGIDPLFREVFGRNRNAVYSGWFLKEPAACLAAFRNVAEALHNLPQEYTKLPVFAHRITGNPHSFDSNGLTGQLLFMMLYHQYAEADSAQAMNGLLSKAELENEIYGLFKIIKDDIMNFTAVNGLVAFRGEEPVAMWQDACLDRIPWNVPVRQLLGISRIRPCKGNQIFLIENSGVYSILLDAFPDCPMVCTNGQFRYAVWLLLERIPDDGITLYYSSDFDPEGLLMADTLKGRYGEKLQLLGMTIDHYSASKPAAEIDEKRMQKLKRIQSGELRGLTDLMAEKKVAGYQEGILEELLDEIRLLREG